MTTGVRARLAGTLGDVTTRRVGALVAGTGATVGVMEVVKRRKRWVRAQSVSSQTAAKGETGTVLNSASDRVLAARVDTSTEEGAGMTHYCGKN